MKMQIVAMCGVLGVMATGMVGCDLLVSGHARHDEVVVQDRGPGYDQVVVVDQPPQYVVVQQAPPPMRVEVRPAPPSADVVWIDGYWNWDNTTYVWQSGRYMRPPQPDVVWVAPRYENVGGSVRITKGQWSKKGGNGGGDGRGNPGNGRGRGN